MAHNINSIAYVGETPWHELGINVPAGISADEMIVAAGLDWKVAKRPVGRPADRATRFVLERLPRHEGEEKMELGVVSGRYEPLQNSDAFKFFDPIVDNKIAMFETAGALGNGERVWVLAKLPGAIEVVNGDEVERFLLLSNSHDGKGAVSIKFTPIRVVCQNTLVYALKEGEKALGVRHSRTTMSVRLDEISKMIAQFNATFAEAAGHFRQLAAVKMDKKKVSAYLDAVFPPTETQLAKGERSDRWNRVMAIYEDDRRNKITPAGRHTLWAAYNAVTYDEDYRPSESSKASPILSDAAKADSRLNRVWFGTGADLKVRALHEGLQLAAQWA